jgi:hypothetical protein
VHLTHTIADENLFSDYWLLIWEGAEPAKNGTEQAGGNQHPCRKS